MTKRRQYRRPIPAAHRPVPVAPAVEHRFTWKLVGALSTLALIAVVALARGGPRPWSRPAAQAESAPRLRPDDLIVEPHTVRLPEEYIAIRDWTIPRRWMLPRYTRETALALLRDLPGAADALQCDASGCSLRPTVEGVSALSPEARSRLYSVLADIPGNPQADDAFHRPPERGPFSAIPLLPSGAGRWLDALTWSQNGTPTYSDLGTVCAHLAGRAECNDFVRTMLSRPSHAVNIRVREPGSIERALAEFGPDRRPAVAATLRAAAASGARTVPLAALLPAWAQQRLDTYPTREEDWTNCFWTALRFVDQAPGPVTDDAALEAGLLGFFERVSGPHYFGDIMVLRDQNQRAVHAASVLVAGYVFTKNGFGHLQAWRIVPTVDVTADFPDTSAVEYWRVRAAPAR